MPLLRPAWDSSLESLEPWTAALIKTGRSRGQGVQRNKSSKGGNIEAVSCSLTRSNKLCPPCYQSSSLTASLSISSTHPWQPPSACLQSGSPGVMEQVCLSKLQTEPQLQFVTDSQPCSKSGSFGGLHFSLRFNLIQLLNACECLRWISLQEGL